MLWNMLIRYLFKGTIKDDTESKDSVYPKGHSFQAEAVVAKHTKLNENDKQD
jgi:hypothetical protein